MAIQDLGIPAVTRRVEGEAKAGRARVLVAGSGALTARCPGEDLTGRPVGVTRRPEEGGRAVPLQEYGYAEVETSGAVEYGAAVSISDAAGRVGPASSESVLVGTAEQEAAGAGQIITVDLRRMGQAAPSA